MIPPFCVLIPAAQIGALKKRENGQNSLLDSSLEEIGEQRFLYLRNAFMGFVFAKEVDVVRHMGRVICAILNYSPEEQRIINEAIVNFAPAIVTFSTMGSFFGRSFF